MSRDYDGAPSPDEWAAMNLPAQPTAEDVATLIGRTSLTHEELVAAIRRVSLQALEKAERFERDWYDAKAQFSAALRAEHLTALRSIAPTLREGEQEAVNDIRERGYGK